MTASSSPSQCSDAKGARDWRGQCGCWWYRALCPQGGSVLCQCLLPSGRAFLGQRLEGAVRVLVVQSSVSGRGKALCQHLHTGRGFPVVPSA